MSELGILGSGTAVETETTQRKGRPVLAVALALALAIVVGLAVFRLQDAVALVYLVPLGIAGFIGLLALFGVIAGLVHFGHLPRQRVFFESLVDALGDSVVVTDARGRVIFANSNYRKLVTSSGIGRMVGVENLYNGYPDVSEHVYRLSQAAREGRAGVEDFRLNEGSAAAGASADRPVWIHASVAPLASGLGQSYTLWRLADVTADRAQQENAFSNLQYIINYLDHAPAGFFSSMEDGKVAYVNATLADWLELDLSQTTDGNLTLSDLLSEAGQQLVLGIAPQAGKTRTEAFDLDLRSASGSVIPVRIVHRADFDHEGRAQPSRSLVLDLRGGMPGSDTSGGSDITLARLINEAPIGIAQLDARGVITNTNPAFAKLTTQAARGAVFTALVGDEYREALKKQFDACKAGEEGDGQLDVVFAGSEDNTGQVRFSLASQPETGEAAVTLYAVDTTERKTLEVQFAQSQKMQAVGQLAGGVAHDFNNVLTAIIGFSDLLLAKLRPTDPSFGDIMNIKQNANRAANLVRQLLAFSRRQTLRPQVLSLTDVISDLGNLLGRLLGEKTELKVVHGRDVGLVKVDVNQFEQVIINLAVNARDAMSEGGVLTVQTANVSVEESRHVKPGLMPEGEYVRCDVIDTGSGMPPEVLAKIYEPFYSTKEVGKGTGLGLSTVYGIIKQTGGFIFCDSAVGRGTTFSIYLPRHAADEVQAGDEQTEAKEVRQRTDLTGQGTILLVEDEDAVRAFASRALASRGYTVLEADSGQRALEVVDEQQGIIDLVLSDVVMPEMDGPTMLNELRKRGIKTKVVFISGYAEDAFEKNLEGQEDFAFLPKPFSLKQLAEAVKDALN